jgi:hypothetical protein
LTAGLQARTATSAKRATKNHAARAMSILSSGNGAWSTPRAPSQAAHMTSSGGRSAQHRPAMNRWLTPELALA